MQKTKSERFFATKRTIRKFYRALQLFSVGAYIAFVFLLLADRAFWWEQAQRGGATYAERLNYGELAISGARILLIVMLTNLALWNIARKLLQKRGACK